MLSPTLFGISLASYMRSQKELKIWADGICINQSDIEERNAQVRLIGSIYQLARHTIIFLGEATRGSTAVLDALTSPKPSDDTSRGSAFMSNVSRLFVAEFNSIHTAGNSKELTESDTFPVSSLTEGIRRDAEEHILKWEWFRRVWTLQELVLSPDPWIQVGYRRIRWNVFSDSFLHPAWGGEHHEAFKLLSDMRDARLNFGASLLRQHKSSSETADKLLRVLHALRGFGCTKEVDRVYAHLGILGINSSDEKLMETVQIDYGQEWPELFKQVTLYMISNSSEVSPSTTTHPKEHFKVTDINLVYATFDSSQVLGCIGTIDSTIDVVLDSMPPTVDLKAIYKKVKTESRKPDREGIADMTYQNIYSKFCDWLASQNIAIRPRSALDARSLRFDDPLYFPIYYSPLSGNLDHFLVPKYEYDPSRETKFTTVGYLLCGMTDMDGPGCFPGKKIALLQNDNFALVPMHAEAGDAICRFNSSPVPYVLRRKKTNIAKDLDVCIIERFKDKKVEYEKKHGSDPAWKTEVQYREVVHENVVYGLDISTVEHFSLIGEFFTESGEPEKLKTPRTSQLDKASDNEEESMNPRSRSIIALH
ncbi:hypothetical protein G7Y89_g2030 [Cudoniella acicularis]|uniref:Heterokaryon incompatibility domain-containing protein n=1 Tax=Cudoniella acicularis TaxID=354080 RepID=A0A8H4W7C4_9HELO|nr:hypothetical protein G7Y89_g2030 [Cudoniella acicularis]